MSQEISITISRQLGDHEFISPESMQAAVLNFKPIPVMLDGIRVGMLSHAELKPDGDMLAFGNIDAGLEIT